MTKYLAPDFETILLSGQISEGEQSSEYLLQKLDIQPVYIPTMQREIGWGSDLKAYRFIRQVIGDFKPDIVHTHAAKAGALGRWAAIQARVPIIVHTFHGHIFHSYFSPLKTRVFIEIEKYLARKSTSIVAVSDMLKKELWEKYGICRPEKIAVVYNGFDLDIFGENQVVKREEFRERYFLGADDIVVGMIGRMVPVKNYPMFLRAIALLLPQFPELKAVIVGDGEERVKLEMLANQLNIPFSQGEKAAPLIFTSWIKEIDNVCAGLDIIALTSFNEGTPVTMIEAQAAGKPVVCTNVGGTADIVLDKKSGFLCESEDGEAFVKYLTMLLKDRALRLEMGKNGREFAIRRFTYKHLAENMKKLYYSLLQR